MGIKVLTKTVFFVFLILITNLTLSGIGTVAIENAEQFWFYYTIDPAYLRMYEYTDPNFAHYVLKYFARPVGDEEFLPLSPGQVHYYNDLEDGEHILVGFFILDNKLVYPVKIINLVSGRTPGERRYIVYNTISNISVTSGTGLLTDFVPEHLSTPGGIIIDPAIDNSYKDWRSVPVSAGFSKNFNPVYFNQEVNGAMKTLSIENSLYWTYGGTQIENFKAVLDDFYFYFYFSTYKEIAEGLIVYMYLYKNREYIRENQYTIEVNIDNKNKSGTVYLWEKGKTAPTRIGTCTASGYYLEGGIELHLLPEQLRYELLGQYSFDLTTCYFKKDTKLYEEFFFTSIYFRDIPSKVELLQRK